MDAGYRFPRQKAFPEYPDFSEILRFHPAYNGGSAVPAADSQAGSKKRFPLQRMLVFLPKKQQTGQERKMPLPCLWNLPETEEDRFRTIYRRRFPPERGVLLSASNAVHADRKSVV